MSNLTFILVWIARKLLFYLAVLLLSPTVKHTSYDRPWCSCHSCDLPIIKCTAAMLFESVKTCMCKGGGNLCTQTQCSSFHYACDGCQSLSHTHAHRAHICPPLPAAFVPLKHNISDTPQPPKLYSLNILLYIRVRFISFKKGST